MSVNVAITGASGFIGQHVAASLSNEPNVQCFPLSYHHDFVNDKLTHVDGVIHLGAFTPKSGAEANDVEQSFSNISNTMRLLERLPNTPSKFIFASTLDVYEPCDAAIDETMPTIPSTLYGQSKLYCEKMLSSWAEKNDVVLQILRVGHTYGAGEEAYKKLIPVTIEKIHNGENPVLFGDGQDKRSFIHISDVCRCIVQAIAFDQPIGPVNLCSNHAFSIQDIVQNLLDVVGNETLEIEYQDTAHSGKDVVFNVKKMHELFGEERMCIKEGLRDEYEQFCRKKH